MIDYRYFEAEKILALRVRREQDEFEIESVKHIDQDLGLEFESDRIIRCTNKCIFCFCHNNPRHLRRSLYIKDDDYRRSFLQGSFTTLTNLSEADVERIIRLRLSPLYVSVQATEIEARQRLFGRRNVAPVLPILERLAANRISFHCQVVVVPAYNDDSILDKTARDLADLRPQALSLAIVPVGLTLYSDHRLKPIGPAIAAGLIRVTEVLRKKYGNRGNRFAYAADELFIKAGIDIPAAGYYDEFPQIENGVGMVRDFLDTFPNRLPQRVPGYWITGASMYGIWRKKILPEHDINMRIIRVRNRLFGDRVTVSGLLSGRDIMDGLTERKIGSEPVVLPPNCLNSDGLFLDDLTTSDLEHALNTTVIRGTYSFTETRAMLS